MVGRNYAEPALTVPVLGELPAQHYVKCNSEKFGRGISLWKLHGVR